MQIEKYLLPGYDNQRETKLFEFSRDTNKEELKIRENHVTLQWHDATYHNCAAFETAVFYK